MLAIEINEVWKKFRIRHEEPTTLERSLYSFLKREISYEDFWALKNIYLQVQTGETIGLIGKNGAGKTTLLRLIAKILTPNRGLISTNGKVSTFLELGTGFHPDLTGLENLRLYAAILGLSKREIENKLDDIVSFAEIKEFFDVQISSYSYGMRLRLAFSLAINVNPDILLFDEILAVGDIGFRKKCLEKITEFRKGGKTIVLSSQNMDIVNKLCDRVMLLQKGKIISSGRPQSVVHDYLESVK